MHVEEMSDRPAWTPYAVFVQTTKEKVNDLINQLHQGKHDDMMAFTNSQST